MQLRERFAAKVSQLAQDVGIEQGETVKNAARQLGGAGRYRLPLYKFVLPVLPKSVRFLPWSFPPHKVPFTNPFASANFA